VPHTTSEILDALKRLLDATWAEPEFGDCAGCFRMAAKPGFCGSTKEECPVVNACFILGRDIGEPFARTTKRVIVDPIPKELIGSFVDEINVPVYIDAIYNGKNVK
jgi:hypothetical protein